MLSILTPLKVGKDNLNVEERWVSEAWASKSVSRKGGQEGQAICLRAPLTE